MFYRPFRSRMYTSINEEPNRATQSTILPAVINEQEKIVEADPF